MSRHLAGALLIPTLCAASAAAQTYDVVKAFSAAGEYPSATLIQGIDGNLYGTTRGGGAHGSGTVFKIDMGGTALTTLHSFSSTDGATPWGALTQGQDGYLYGTTFEGGANGYGTIFKIDIGGTILTTLHSFFLTDGSNPYAGLTLGQDGYLYGTTGKGGAGDFGTIFKIDTDGTVLTTLHSFSSTDGASPNGGLIQGADGNLYGTTEQGGGEDCLGTVFMIDTNGSALTTLHCFRGGEGGAPEARLVQGSDGYLYGTTFYGGTIFKLDISGSVFAVLYTLGGLPWAGLVQGADGNLYGTTTEGGESHMGTVFKIDTDGSAFATVHDFSGSDGKWPDAGLVQGSDGNLYGAARQGGAGGWGTIFRSDTSGSTFVTLYDFASLDGSEPIAGLIQATDGYFYGTARYGGAYGYGTVFKMDSTGSTFTTLHSFTFSGGAYPTQELVQGADGSLYGTTLQGGPLLSGRYGIGTIFKIDTSGSPFAILHTFRGVDGVYPQGLIQGTDGKLYGTVGGPISPQYSAHGRVFKINTTGSAFTPLHDFLGSDGATPTGRLVQGSDGHLYGTTILGGAIGNGTIFKMDPNGAAFTTLHDFAGDEGANPRGLIQAADGSLYGTSSQGGANNLGTVYQIDTNGSTLTTLHHFAGSDGANPFEGLLQGADGSLYGTTGHGGTNGVGAIFRVATNGSAFTLLHSFTGTDGETPFAPLIQTTDGSFHGTAAVGGPALGGVVFRLTLNAAAFQVTGVAPTSGSAFGGAPISISGSGFEPTDTVSLGGAAAANVNVAGANQIDATTPALAPGALHDLVVTKLNASSAQLSNAFFADFLDVSQSDIFHDDVETIFRAGITAGCGGGFYCRDNPVRRDQMAVFLSKAEHGAAYTPPPCAGVFPDTPCPGPFTDWVEQLAAEQITGGCGGGNYCPGNPVTRSQIAVFLLKTEHGASYAPPACAGTFADVACPSQFADWIERLYAEGITGGCQASPLLYCPGNAVTRGQMAVFLTKAFGLQ